MNLEWFGYAAAVLTTSSFIPQAVMTIRPGPQAGSDAVVVGRYFYRRFLRPDLMYGFMDGLTEITVEPGSASVPDR